MRPTSYSLKLIFLIGLIIWPQVTLSSEGKKQIHLDNDINIDPYISLLLSGNYNCISSSPITIKSIYSERFVPYSPVSLMLDNIASVKVGASYILYNNFKVPISDVNYSTGVVTSLLPNMPGTFTVSITSPCAHTTNSKSITIDAVSLPAGKTTDEVLDEFFVEMLEYQSTMMVEASNEAHTEEQREGYARLALEYDVFIQFLGVLLSEIANSEERKEVAALLVNFLSTNSASVSSVDRVSNISSVGSKWDIINIRRKALARAGLLTATTNWGLAGVLTNSPPVKIVDTCLTVLKLLESSHGLYPVLLDDFIVEIEHQDGGFHTDSSPANVNCKGTFIPYASLFIKTGLSFAVDKLFSLITKNSAPDSWDPFLSKIKSQGKEDTLIGNFLNKAVGFKIDAVLLDISRSFDKIIGNLVDAENVEFPCIGGSDLSSQVIYRPPHRVTFNWERSSTIKPISVGKSMVYLVFMDSLNNDNHKEVSRSFIVKVDNYFPEIVNNPRCGIEQYGHCYVSVILEDKDPADTPFASLANNNSLSEGTATLHQVDGNEFTFKYVTNDDSRDNYSDVLLINYGDGNQDHKTISIPVTTESKFCDSGPETLIWKGREWQRCNRGWSKKQDDWDWDDVCVSLNLGGHKDWRLPTVGELNELVSCSNGAPTPSVIRYGEQGEPYSAGCDLRLTNEEDIDWVFPTLPSGFVHNDNEDRGMIYWTSSRWLFYRYDVDFFDGRVSYDGIRSQHIRCIRNND